MGFDQALVALKAGSTLTREEWNGSQVLTINGVDQIVVSPANPDGTTIYNPNQIDILAEDWYVQDVPPATPNIDDTNSNGIDDTEDEQEEVEEDVEADEQKDGKN